MASGFKEIDDPCSLAQKAIYIAISHRPDADGQRDPRLIMLDRALQLYTELMQCTLGQSWESTHNIEVLLRAQSPSEEPIFSEHLEYELLRPLLRYSLLQEDPEHVIEWLTDEANPAHERQDVAAPWESERILACTQMLLAEALLYTLTHELSAPEAQRLGSVPMPNERASSVPPAHKTCPSWH